LFAAAPRRRVPRLAAPAPAWHMSTPPVACDTYDFDDDDDEVDMERQLMSPLVSAFFMATCVAAALAIASTSELLSDVLLLSMYRNKDNVTLHDVLVECGRSIPLRAVDLRSLARSSVVTLRVFGLCPDALAAVERDVLPVYERRCRPTGTTAGMRRKLSPRAVLHLTLRKLRTGVTNRVLMSLGFSESMVSRMIRDMLPCIVDGLFPRFYPTMPSLGEQRLLYHVQLLKTPTLPPGLFIWGWVDGVRMHIERAFADRMVELVNGVYVVRDAYYNAYVKGCSVNSVLVWDSLGRMVAAHMGVNGRVHDSRIMDALGPGLRRAADPRLRIGGDAGFVKQSLRDLVVTPASVLDTLAAHGDNVAPAAGLPLEEDPRVLAFTRARQAAEHNSGTFSSTWRILRTPLPADPVKRQLILSAAACLHNVRWYYSRQIEELTLAFGVGAVAPRHPAGVWYPGRNPVEYRLAASAYRHAEQLQARNLLAPGAGLAAAVAARAAHDLRARVGDGRVSDRDLHEEVGRAASMHIEVDESVARAVDNAVAPGAPVEYEQLRRRRYIQIPVDAHGNLE